MASAIAEFKRSTSADADFIFWPATASCSVNAEIRASDSFNLDNAISNVLCLLSTSPCAFEISNLIRSQLWVIVSSLACNSCTKALISISEVDDAEPPRARFAVITSPSRVTTVTLGWERIMPSASRALSATTVLDKSEARSSEISEERTCEVSAVSPAGTDVALCDPGW